MQLDADMRRAVGGVCRSDPFISAASSEASFSDNAIHPSEPLVTPVHYSTVFRIHSSKVVMNPSLT